MAASDITFTGLWYLKGKTVSCCIAGLDCGDFVVDTYGQIVVPITSHAQLSQAYIARVAVRIAGSSVPNVCALTLGNDTYRVPVVIGRKYTTKGQMLRPMAQQDIKSQSGDGLGHQRRGHQYSFLFSGTSQGVGTGILSVGTDFVTMWPVNLKQPDGYTTWLGTSGFDGVHWDALQDNTEFDTMLTWSVSRPVPVTITAAAVHLHQEDR